MKKTTFLIAITCCICFFAAPLASGQPPATPTVATPIGKLCEVTMIGAWLGNSTVGTPLKVEGYLLMITAEWVVVKSGTYEHWLPKDKVLDLRVTR